VPKGSVTKHASMLAGCPMFQKYWQWANQMPPSGRGKKKELWLHPLTKQ